MGTAAVKVQRRILIVDDEQSICDVLSIALKKEGYHVQAETNPIKALDIFRREPFDLVIQDLKMPQMDGIELLREIKKVKDDTLVVIMTAYSSWDRAVEAMRLGAFHYLKKPFDHNDGGLRGTVARAMLLKESTEKMSGTQDQTMVAIGNLMGDSAAMRDVRDIIRRVAMTDSTVLIHGESGTGKELVARAVHSGSPRGFKQFVPVNCGAITETLLESELFGHVRGAFTGAVTDKPGLMEVAAGGTFFLDEISEMSMHLQVKLLRAIEEREFKPVGSTQVKSVDVRLITATNRDLKTEVRQGRFREDLYYRLNVIAIALPPLRDRREDIPLLSGHFLRRFSREMKKSSNRFTAAARNALERHDWPGNVRELENAIQRAVALGNGEVIDESDLGISKDPTVMLKTYPGGHPAADLKEEESFNLDEKMAEIEKKYIKDALGKSAGNYTRAAQFLKMSLRSFRYKLQKYGLDRDA